MSASSERNYSFWLQYEHKLATFERKWYNECGDDKDYTMGSELSSAEKIVGNHLVLASPTIDSYLKQIGKAFFSKLSRSSLTGLAPPVIYFIPQQI